MPVLKNLQWFPSGQRWKSKLTKLTLKSHYNLAPISFSIFISYQFSLQTFYLNRVCLLLLIQSWTFLPDLERFPSVFLEHSSHSTNLLKGQLHNHRLHLLLLFNLCLSIICSTCSLKGQNWFMNYSHRSYIKPFIMLFHKEVQLVIFGMYALTIFP